jgi:hypothetical protein
MVKDGGWKLSLVLPLCPIQKWDRRRYCSSSCYGQASLHQKLQARMGLLAVRVDSVDSGESVECITSDRPTRINCQSPFSGNPSRARCSLAVAQIAHFQVDKFSLFAAVLRYFLFSVWQVVVTPQVQKPLKPQIWRLKRPLYSRVIAMTAPGKGEEHASILVSGNAMLNLPSSPPENA